jgi:hypothetical protein
MALALLPGSDRISALERQAQGFIRQADPGRRFLASQVKTLAGILLRRLVR